jgi:hypothetical protein
MNPILPTYVIIDIPVTILFVFLFVVFRSWMRRIAFILGVRELWMEKVVGNQKLIIWMFDHIIIDDYWSAINEKSRSGEIISIPEEMLKEADASTLALMEKAEPAVKSVQHRSEWEEITNFLDFLDWLVYATEKKASLLLPTSSKKRLESQLKYLLALVQECGKVAASIKNLEEAAVEATAEEARRHRENFRELLRQKALEENRQYLVDLREKISEDLHLVLSNLTHACDSHFLDTAAATKVWEKKLADLPTTEEGNTSFEEVVEHYQDFGRFFSPTINPTILTKLDHEDHGIIDEKRVHNIKYVLGLLSEPDKKNALTTEIELRVKDISEVEKMLDPIGGLLRELNLKTGWKIEIPGFEKAKEMLVKEIPLEWITLDPEFPKSLDTVRRLLNKARDNAASLGYWADIVALWKDRLVWLNKMEEIATGKYSITIEARHDWTQAKSFIEQGAADNCKKLKLEDLTHKFTDVTDAFEARWGALYEKVSKLLDDLKESTPGDTETIKSIVEFKNRIAKGPDGDKTTNLNLVPLKNPIFISGETVKSPYGTT